MKKKPKQISEPFTAIIAGKAGCGKTTACINRIEECISTNKILKHDYRIIVVTDLPDEYKKFKPITDIKKLATFKNKVMVLPSSKIEDVFLAKNCLLIFDCKIKITRHHISYFAAARHYDRSVFLVMNTLTMPALLWQNIDYIQLFKMFHSGAAYENYSEHAKIIEMASMCVAVKGFPFFSVIVNLSKYKISVNQDIAFHAARTIATEEVEQYDIKNLKALGERIIEYANYFHD